MEQARQFAEQGVRVCRGDFAEPGSLPAAFDGAEQLLLVSVNKLGDEAVRQHGNAIQAAKAAGVRRILYTSHQAASAASAFAPGRDHAATEALLQTSGVPYVSLRNGFYAESALFQLGGVRQSGKVALPQDGPVSWTVRADLVAAAVAGLLDPAVFDGISPPLTAMRTLDFAEIATIAGRLLGQPVAREVIADEQYRAALVARGLPEAMAVALGGLYRASRAGEFDVVDPTLRGLLGREPTPMEDVLAPFLAQAGASSH